MKKETSKAKIIKRIVILFVLALISFKGLVEIYHIFLPLTLVSYNVKIETPDTNKPTFKTVQFKVMVANESKKPVDVKFHFTKNEDTAKWYPYYNTIPLTYITEIYHIEPDELKSISSEIVVETNDERLVSSLFTYVEVQYEIIK